MVNELQDFMKEEHQIHPRYWNIYGIDRVLTEEEKLKMLSLCDILQQEEILNLNLPVKKLYLGILLMVCERIFYLNKPLRKSTIQPDWSSCPLGRYLEKGEHISPWAVTISPVIKEYFDQLHEYVDNEFSGTIVMDATGHSLTIEEKDKVYNVMRILEGFQMSSTDIPLDKMYLTIVRIVCDDLTA